MHTENSFPETKLSETETPKNKQKFETKKSEKRNTTQFCIWTSFCSIVLCICRWVFVICQLVFVFSYGICCICPSYFLWIVYWFYLFLQKTFYVKVDFFICKWKCRDPVPDLESARKISRELIRPTFWIRETLAWFWFEDDHDDDIDYDDYDGEYEIDKGD